MSKSLKNIGLGVLIIIAIAATVGGSIYLANRTSHKKTASSSCSSSHPTLHVVAIKGGTVTPQHTDARRCDTLTILNIDKTNRLIAFGEHEHHTPYDGVTEKLLGQNQTLKVTLIDTGNFRFHDHLDDVVQGTFSVRNP